MGRREDNTVLLKSIDFAVRIVNLYKYLCSSKKDNVLSKQLLRSGTSIGANLNEAQESISQKNLSLKFILHSKKPKKRSIGLNCF